MVKSILSTLFLIALSILVVLGMPIAQKCVMFLVWAHDGVAQLLVDVFSGGTVGSLIRQVIALLVVPLIVGLIPALIFFIAKRRWMPYFLLIVWILWLVQTSALVIQYKVAVAA